MRGLSSHDGKLHGNAQMVDRYNEAHGHKKPQRPHEEGGESGGEHDPSGHDEIKQVVAEHGEAHKHIITKKPDGGYHSVTHHEDGHVHHEDHESIEDAHTHGAHAMDDTEHLGDMDQDDEKVAMESNEAEMHPSHKTTDIGYM